MDYGMIGKIEKAKRYVEERDRRVRFETLKVTFMGDNNDHTVTLQNDKWHCTCDFFKTRSRCCHTIALEMILKGMLPEMAVDEVTTTTGV